MKKAARVSTVDRGIVMMALSLPMLVLGPEVTRLTVALFAGL